MARALLKALFRKGVLMKVELTTRRMFLQGAGGAMLAIPFLSSLVPRQAGAQTAVPKRYVAIWSNYDYGHGSHWYPTLEPLPLSLQKTGEAVVGYQTLKALLGSQPQLSTILGPGLNKHLGSLNLMRGLDFIEYYGHGFAHGFGNLASSQSNTALQAMAPLLTLDQVLGRNPRINPVASEPYLLSNDNDTGGSYGPDGSGAIGRRATPGKSPLAIYQSLFRSGQVPESGQAQVANPRSDVMSRVLDDYRKVRNGPQISTLDKAVLDNALDKLSEVQRALTPTTTASGCAYQSLSRSGASDRYDDVPTYKAMADLVVAAMMCDLNRVFHFTGYLDDAYYNKSSGNFHDGHSHSPLQTVAGKLNHQYLAEIQGQLMQNFVVPLLDGMASAIDPTNGKSLLFNSLVHFTIESGTVHSFSDAPTLLAGNAGGALTSGHMIDYSNRALYDGAFNVPAEGGWTGTPTDANFVGFWQGLPVNRLFNTVLQAMGLQRSDYERADINGAYKNRSDGALGAQNDGITDLGGCGYVGLTNPLQSSWESYGHHRYHDYNLHYFKDPLVMPAASAA
jgi:hypothetical protein